MGDIVSIEFEAWWLLVVPLILLLTIGIVVLIVKVPPMINSNFKKKSLTSWIEVKDLLYWLLISCLGAISLFTYQYRGNNEVITHWGFAGTIISIILAVLAIIYTYFQSATTVDSTKRLEESANRVEEATKELEHNNVKNVVAELEEKLRKILSELQKDIKDEIHTKFSLFSEHKNNNSPSDINLKLSEDEWEDYLNKNVNNELTVEGISLSFIFYLYKYNKNYNFEITNKWLENMGDPNPEEASYIIQSQVRVYKSLNIINYEYIGDADIAKINKFDESLNKKMEIIFNSEEKNAKLLNLINALNKTFLEN